MDEMGRRGFIGEGDFVAEPVFVAGRHGGPATNGLWMERQ